MPALHPLCCGRLSFDRSVFFPDASPGTLTTVPVPGFLVIHPKGKLLFDTGVACEAAADPAGVLGRRLASTFRLTGASDETAPGQLAHLGLTPADITHVANSHLHFDHCGCNPLFTRSAFLIQRAEMQAAQAPDSRYDPRLWQHPLDYRLIDGEHDVFGDGTVVLMPTPGHTPGHQSLVVQVSRDSRYVLSADACYSGEHMARELLPSVVWDGGQMLDSMRRLRALGEQSGTRLLYGHDPVQWAALGAARQSLN
jgi:glyoxylase-like metal-dependent hydrolase (beta-lactamase superfamily II)